MADPPRIADDFINNKVTAIIKEASRAPPMVPNSLAPGYVLENGGSATSGADAVIKTGSVAGASRVMVCLRG